MSGMNRYLVVIILVAAGAHHSATCAGTSPYITIDLEAVWLIIASVYSSTCGYPIHVYHEASSFVRQSRLMKGQCTPITACMLRDHLECYEEILYPSMRCQ